MEHRKHKDKFMLRLPDGWRDEIKRLAVRNRRSMNQEVLAALEGVVAAPSEAQHDADAAA